MIYILAVPSLVPRVRAVVSRTASEDAYFTELTTLVSGD